VRDIRASGGYFLAVSDDAILGAIQTLARYGGVLAEPAAAAGAAALEVALASGCLAPDERVVVLITGTGLKTPQYLQPCGQVFGVHARLDEVEGALSEL
jgi:threonine synthase